MFQLTSLTPFKGLDHHTVEIQAFPFSIGRHDSADFHMEGAGIWENHALISLNEDGRPVLSICKQASCLLNDEVIQGVHVLKSGDILKIGEIMLRLDLSPCSQRNSLLQEGCVYILTGVLIISQFICVYLFLDQ